MAILHVDSLISAIESMVRDGSVFRAGETYQYGWMLTLVQELPDGTLTLREPDMKSMPIEFVSGVTETVRHMTLQLFALDSFAVDRSDMDIPTVRESGIACQRYRDGIGFIMDRAEPSDDHDSGWFIGCVNETCDHNDPNSLRRISLYELFLGRPEIRDWVTFPIGSMIQRTDDAIYVFRDGTQLTLIQGSFVDATMNRR